jgi:hypothetical protein
MLQEVWSRCSDNVNVSLPGQYLNAFQNVHVSQTVKWVFELCDVIRRGINSTDSCFCALRMCCLPINFIAAATSLETANLSQEARPKAVGKKAMGVLLTRTLYKHIVSFIFVRFQIYFNLISFHLCLDLSSSIFPSVFRT